jgi:hypothetical protein
MHISSSVETTSPSHHHRLSGRLSIVVVSSCHIVKPYPKTADELYDMCECMHIDRCCTDKDTILANVTDLVRQRGQVWMYR